MSARTKAQAPKGRHTPTSPRRKYRMAVRDSGGAPRSWKAFNRLRNELPEYAHWIEADFGRYLRRRRAKNSDRRRRLGMKRTVRTLGLKRSDIREWAA